MLIPVLTFILVAGIVFGTFWVFILRPEQATESALRKRLKRGVALAKDVPASVKAEAQRLSSMPAFDRLLASRAQAVMPLQRLIEHSGVKTTAGVVILGSACLALIGFVFGQTWWKSPLFGLFLGMLLAPVPAMFLSWKRGRRMDKFEELFPEAIDLMTRAIRAGHGLTTALGMVATEMPEPIGTEFKLLHDRQNFGLPLDDAMREFAARVPLLSAKFFVTAVLTQRETGGNLAEVLTNLASVIRDRFNVMRQIRVKSAHGRMTGIVLAGLPPALVVALMIVNPGYLNSMFQDPLGIRMLLAAVVLQVVGALIIRKLVRIEY